MTPAQIAALLILASFSIFTLLYAATETAARALNRLDHAPDPAERDLRDLSVVEAAAVVGLESFFDQWTALVEQERQP